jgi:signal transduction histidine kinase/CheY-like chemotaxis protein
MSGVLPHRAPVVTLPGNVRPTDVPLGLSEAQAAVRDVIALSTLPAVWMGAQPERIAESLLAVLQTTLGPACSYIRIPSLLEGGATAVERCLIDGQEASAEQQAALADSVRAWAEGHDPDEIMDAPFRLSGRSIRICTYPLGHENGTGVLAAGFANDGREPLPPTPLQRTLLNIAANQAITAYRNIALHLQAEAARVEAQALYEVSRLLAAQLDLQTIMQLTTDAVTRLTGAKFGAFFHNVVSEAGESYQLFTLSGAPREAFAQFGMPRNTPVFEHTFRGKGPVRVGDIQKDHRYGKLAPHHGLPKGHLPVRSYLAVPVFSRTGEVFGGLFLGHPSSDVFGERAERIAVGIAGQTAVAIETARLFTQVGRELAQRKVMEERLREEERRKDEFLATLSHELRNPLAPIRTALSIMRLASRDPERMEKAIGVIERQSSHLTRIVDDLLDISRITRGKVELRKERVDLGAVIAQAIEGARSLSDAREVRLFVNVPSRKIELEADPVRVVQILGNLLHNACKYSRGKGVIHVEAKLHEGDAIISVRDDGIGIDAAHLPTIFDLFVQVESSSSRAPGGLGIGLSLAKSLVEMHGGTIEAHSEGLGKGSEFVVRLPAAPELPETAGPPCPATVRNAPIVHSLRVVVVDDYEDALDSLASLLDALGNEVFTARSGEDALRTVQSQQPDVVLLDIGLPGMDGYEVARRIRNLPGGKGILLVAMTGWGQQQDKQKAAEVGFDLHLTKPADPSELERLLEERAWAKVEPRLA